MVNTNTDADSESFRADLTTWSDVVAGTKEYKADFTPSVTGATATIADLLWTHVVRSAAPEATPTATPEATPTATPTTPAGPSTVRLTTAGAVDQGAQGWFQYYPAGIAYNIKNVDLGSTTTLTYNVAGAGAGKTVTFVFNKAYSNSTAHTSVGTAIGTGSSDTKVTGVTDANGNVSFTLVNTDTEAQGARTFTQVAAYVDSAIDAFDVTDIVFVPLAPPTEASIYLSSATRATMSDKSYWWTNEPASRSLVKFVTAGDVLTLDYLVLDGAGAALSGVIVTLNKSGAATYTGDLVGETDSSGHVTFTLTNTNTAAQAELYPVAPSNMIWWDDSRGAALAAAGVAELTANFEPSINTGYAAVQHIDRVWSHVVQPVPNAPVNVTATRGKAAATVAWDAPVGGEAITGYTVTATAGEFTKSVTASASATSAVVTGLTNGTVYTVSVVANGQYGASDASNTASVTPATSAAKAPSAPTFGTAIAGSRTLVFPYVVGADNGSTITSVEYSIDGGTTWIVTTASPISLSGLTNGVKLPIKIRATNDVGVSSVKTLSSAKPIALANAIDFTQPANMTYGDADQTLVATANGGTTVLTVTSPLKCSIVDGKVRTLAAGICKIKATNLGDADYAVTRAVTLTFTIAKAANAITITEGLVSDSTLALGSYTVTAVGTSGGLVKIKTSPSSTCSYSAIDGKLTVKKTTTCVVTFSLAASTNYLAAESVVRTVN